MAPGTRRANRGGYVEHDDFEGLPVRQWRQEWTNIAPPPQPELHQNDVWAIELLHGMPKDAVLLPPHTQELLRAARSGRLYKRPPPTEDEDADGDTLQPDKLDKKEDDFMSQGYQLRLWKQIPKNIEAPVISHLAKRRKNTVTIASRTVEEKVQGPTVTRATVRRIDAAGNPYTEEVTLAEGQQLDGEIISTRVEALPAAKAEAAAPVLAPARRRPPPPKRKAKAGPGRGKKKLKNVQADGQTVGTTVVTRAGAPAIKPESSEVDLNLSQLQSLTPTHDSEMADGDDDDDDDDGEDGDDGDEGEEGEAEGDETTQMEHLNNTSIMTTATTIATARDDGHDVTDADFTTEIEIDDSAAPAENASAIFGGLSSPSQPLTLAPPQPSPNAPLEGSPLKNVVVQSPVETTMSLPPPVTAESQTAMDTAMEIDIDEPPVQLPTEEARAESPNDRNLLPPPPDQVGNISSPRTDDGVKSQASHEIEEGGPRESFHPLHQMPAMTEDVIKPEDSVSVTAPMVGSTATSELGATSLDELRTGPLSISGDVPFHVEPETLVEVEGEGEDEDEVTAEPEAGAAPKVEPAAEPEIQLRVQSEVQSDIQPETQPQVRPEVQSEPEADPEAEAEADPDTELPPEAEALLILAENDEGETVQTEEEHNLLSSLLGELDRQDGEAAAKQEQHAAAQQRDAEMTDLHPAQRSEFAETSQRESPATAQEADLEVEALPMAVEDETLLESEEAPVAEAETKASGVTVPIPDVEASEDPIDEEASAKDEAGVKADA